jgi:hypothetical protein
MHEDDLGGAAMARSSTTPSSCRCRVAFVVQRHDLDLVVVPIDLVDEDGHRRLALEPGVGTSAIVVA